MATVQVPRESRVPASRISMPADQPNHPRDLQVVDLLGVLRRHWLIMAGCLGLAWAAAAAYFLLVPPTFESRSQLLVMLKDPRLATTGVSNSRDAQATVTEELLSTQMQIIQSRRIVAESLHQSGLNQLDSIVSELGENKTAEEFVIDRLSVTRGGEGQSREAAVLNIAFRHSSAEESKQILDAIIAHYQAFLNEKFQDVNKEAAELIVRASSELSVELAAAEQAYQEFREKSPILWSGELATNIHRQR
ncbi:MAG: Wzz/FepE/Etk N-terminal domain-containing protein, partial [Planctomycetota bacterium]